MATTTKTTKKTGTDNTSLSNESKPEEVLTIKQYIQRRRLKPYEAAIIANYIRMNENEGFPAHVKRTIAEWDKTYNNMLEEKV